MSTDTDNTRVVAGRYTLDAQIGRGGMGVVWRGEDRMLGRTVALKRVGMVPGGAEPDLVRAEREARLAARLNHPHIVAIFDLVADGESQWLVMEYVEGRTLGQWVKEEGPLDPEQARTTLCQAADALAAAHAAGILHRDVKPSNILIRHDGGVKLTDFGIARATADATLTQTGLVTGSPAYLAPEVAAGGRATAASDVWALGATLYHALEGRPPFDMAGNVVAGMYQIVHGPEPRSDRAGPLAGLMERTLVKDPERRLTMAEVREALTDPQRVTGAAAPTAVTAPVPATVDPAPATVTTPVPADTAPQPVTEPAPQRIAPAPEPRQRRDRRRRAGGRRGLVLGALALLLVLGAVVGLALSLSGGDEPGGTDEPQASDSAGAADPSAPGEEQPAEGSPAPSQRAFVQDYLATATSDPSASWEMLTPDFQRASGGFGSYEGFWSTNESASVSDIRADPTSGRVTYTVTYEKADGSTTAPETVTLQLVESDGRWFIADEL